MNRFPSLFVALLASCGALWGQTGPGGVGSASSNILWMMPESGVLNATGSAAANGEHVKTWVNRSGNAQNLVQGTTNNQPTFISSAINGYPALHFTASSGQRMLASGVANAGTASIWVVGRYSSLPSSNPGIMQGSPSGYGFSSNTSDKSIGLWVSSAGKLWGRGIQSNGTSQNLPQNASVAANTTSIFTSTYGGSLITQYLNGTSVGSVAYNNTLQSWTDLGVGQQADEPWNGDIAEVIVFNTLAGSTQRIIINNYLATKYGVTLGSDQIYVQGSPANGGYSHDVAGIGRISSSDQQTDSRGSGIVEISGATDLNNNEFLFWGHNNGTLGTFSVGDMPTGVQGRWGRVWRVSEVKTTGVAADVGAINIAFDLSGLGAVNASDLRLLIDTNNDGAFSDETPIGGATWISGNIYRFTGVTTITNGVRFTLGTINSAATPLPIDLLFFTATVDPPHMVRLYWTTASEQDNDHFTVQRSTDLETWTDVGKVPGAGNSSSMRSYSLIDPTPAWGTSYYRLQQTDMDGTATVSEVVVVHFDGERRLMVHPNPAHDRFVVENVGPSIRSIWLMDPLGMKVKAPVSMEGDRMTVDVSGLAPGTYVLVLDDGTELRKARVVLD